MRTVKQEVSEFFQAWTDGNIVKMYGLTQKTWFLNHTKNELKGLLPARIKMFRINEITEQDGFLVDADVTIRLGGVDKRVKPRFVRESAPYEPNEKGELGINPISLVKYLDVKEAKRPGALWKEMK